MGVVSTQWCQLYDDRGEPTDFIFNTWMNARSALLSMGFRDSVHYDDGHERWWYNGRKFTLREY